MQIKCLENFLDGPHDFKKDDVRTVSDEDGERFVKNGWAEDVEGKVETGDRNASHGKKLDIDNSVISTNSDKV